MLRPSPMQVRSRHRRSSRLSRLAVATSLVTSLALGAPAVHADDLAAARASFEEGRQAFRARKYAEAAEAYERSSAAYPHPAPLVNAGEAWELEGNFVRAAQACDRALALSLDAKLRASIDVRLARLSRLIGTVSVRGPAHLGVRVDGGQVLRPPAQARVSPGRHRLTYVDVEAPRYEVEDDVVVAAGEVRTLILRAASPGSGSLGAVTNGGMPKADRPPRPAPAGVPPGSWISFGVAAAAGATAATFGVMTLSAKSAYESDPTRDSLDTFRDRRLAANITLGVTALAIGMGVALWIVHESSGSADRSSAANLLRGHF